MEATSTQAVNLFFSGLFVALFASPFLILLALVGVTFNQVKDSLRAERGAQE